MEVVNDSEWSSGCIIRQVCTLIDRRFLLVRFLSAVAGDREGRGRVHLHRDRRRVHWSPQWHDGQRVRHGRPVLPETPEQLYGLFDGSVRFVRGEVRCGPKKVRSLTHEILHAYCYRQCFLPAGSPTGPIISIRSPNL